VLSGILLLLLAAWVSKDLPDPNSLYDRQVAQSTKIYDRTGTVLLYEIHGDEKRTLIPIDQIPQVLRQATVSIEDRKFYEHHGVDWVG
jgi:penicillin-binding protein 1A